MKTPGRFDKYLSNPQKSDAKTKPMLELPKKTVANQNAALAPQKRSTPVTPSSTLPSKPTRTVITPALPTLTSWSYSVYTQYLKCPLSVCFDKIKRIRIAEPPSPAFEKGNAVHKFAEDFIGGRIAASAPVHESLKSVAPRLKQYRSARALVEQDWAFTKDFLPTTWNDWKNCWLRIKVDVCAILYPDATAKAVAAAAKAPNDEKLQTALGAPLVQITDWKTGKVYDDHRQQRSLYAMGGLQLVDLGLLAGGNKDVKVVAEHLYTDTTQSATETFAIKDLKPLKREWMNRIRQMMSDTRYPARTGYHCRYCKFRKSNGGPCPEDM